MKIIRHSSFAVQNYIVSLVCWRKQSSGYHYWDGSDRPLGYWMSKGTSGRYTLSAVTEKLFFGKEKTEAKPSFHVKCW